MTPTLFLTVFSLYIVGMIALSIWISRSQDSGEDFLLGDRSVPLFLILGTTVATMVGTGSSMGAVGRAYTKGWEGAMYGIGGAIGILCLAKLYGNVRKYNFMTFSEEMSFYYGANKTIKNITAVLIFVASIGWLGAHIMGGGKYLAWIAGIDPLYAKIFISMAFGIYVIIGGYMSVVWTDTIQALVLFIGFILMAVMAVIKIGGLEGIDRAMNHHHLDFLSGDRLLPSLSMAFVIFVGVMATPSYRQRIYSSDTIATVKKSFYLSGSLYLLFSFIPALIGISAKTLNPDLPDIDFAFPFLVLEVLPIGLGLIVLIAGLSATMSSASSDAIAGVSILLRDIFILITGKMPSSERTVKLSRIGLTGITGTALLFTLLADNVISYINNMISIVMSGMFVAALLGRFWKRATWQGGLSAYLGGAACSILFLFQPEWKIFWGNSSIPSVICATLCCICVSTCTPQNNITNEEALDTLKKERDLIESTEHHV